MVKEGNNCDEGVMQRHGKITVGKVQVRLNHSPFHFRCVFALRCVGVELRDALVFSATLLFLRFPTQQKESPDNL